MGVRGRRVGGGRGMVGWGGEREMVGWGCEVRGGRVGGERGMVGGEVRGGWWVGR